MLAEAPEFQAAALDALRQPLESGRIAVHRAAGRADFPARFQLVLAANPCPCGRFGSSDGACSCPVATRRRYLARLSGPLLDRIDIRIRVERVTAAQLRMADELPRTTTAQARARVAEARDRARRRLAGTGWSVNAEVPGSRFRRAEWRLPSEVRAPLDTALERGVLSLRGHDRVLRLAWTLADLAGAERPGRREVGAALALRSSDA